MFTPRTQSTFVRCSCCFNLYNSQLHLSPPLRFRGAARACSFSVSRCGCLGQRNSRGRGEFQCTQLGYWVDGCFGGADLTVFHVGNTNILWVSRFWWCRHIQIDFHTFHFSFLLTFCTCFFSFLLTFCTFHFSSFFYFLEPTIYCLFTFLTYIFNTFATTTWLFVATLFN